jgi:geranylgeranyl diphosphate synthase type II
MDLQGRIERNLERAVTYATAGGNPSLMCEALNTPSFPEARASARACASPWLLRLVTRRRRLRAPPRPQSNSCTARRWSMTTCHVSMMRTSAEASPACHTAFGETTAVLTGDALIVLAFETLARECLATPDRIAPLISVISRAVGMPHGIIAGQAWESEDRIDLKVYHRAKTSSLFIGSTTAGAIAAGVDPQNWYGLGEALGDAFQVADDLRDCAANADEIGKPCGQDAAHDRPNAVRELGLEGAIHRLQDLVGEAAASIPDCRGSGDAQAIDS